MCDEVRNSLPVTSGNLFCGQVFFRNRNGYIIYVDVDHTYRNELFILFFIKIFSSPAFSSVLRQNAISLGFGRYVYLRVF